MGYYTQARGTIQVEPPFTERETRYAQTLDFQADQEGALHFPEELWTAYSVIDVVRETLEAFPDHQFTGTVAMQGGEAEDRWDLIFRGRTVACQDYKFEPDGPEMVVVVVGC